MVIPADFLRFLKNVFHILSWESFIIAGELQDPEHKCSLATIVLKIVFTGEINRLGA
jgi:hypothetical protein